MLSISDLQRLRQTLRHPTVTSIEINALPPRVMHVVSDPVTMAELGEEIAYVVLDAEPAVGSTFTGHNRNGLRRWMTVCTITDCDDTRFAYEVRAPRPLDIPISRWQYDLEPLNGGACTRVTVSSWVKAPLWFAAPAIALTGVLDRPSANANHTKATLERLKQHIERG